MPLMTLAEVKTLLSLTSTDSVRDALITTLIPLVQNRIVNYCNNSFILPDVQLEADTIAFTNTAPALITDSDSGFVTALFTNLCDVKVQGSASNDGIYNVATVAAGTLTLTTGEVLITEAASLVITLTRVRWPKELKLDAAQLVNYYLTTQGKMVVSESLPGGYSVTFKDDKGVMSMFNRYRKPYK